MIKGMDANSIRLNIIWLATAAAAVWSCFLLVLIWSGRRIFGAFLLAPFRFDSFDWRRKLGLFFFFNRRPSSSSLREKRWEWSHERDRLIYNWSCLIRWLVGWIAYWVMLSQALASFLLLGKEGKGSFVARGQTSTKTANFLSSFVGWLWVDLREKEGVCGCICVGCLSHSRLINRLVKVNTRHDDHHSQRKTSSWKRGRRGERRRSFRFTKYKIKTMWDSTLWLLGWVWVRPELSLKWRV